MATAIGTMRGISIPRSPMPAWVMIGHCYAIPPVTTPTRHGRTALSSAAGYVTDARGFDRTFGIASQGNDRAVLYDSAGDDQYLAWSDRAVMQGPGYSNDAQGFDRTEANATLGNDQATFYDTAGDDVYTSWWNRAIMSSAGIGMMLKASIARMPMQLKATTRRYYVIRPLTIQSLRRVQSRL